MVSSWNAMMSSMMSRIEIMPITVSPSITGRWRMRLSRISAMHCRVPVRGPTETTLRVMISCTCVSFELRPCSATLRV